MNETVLVVDDEERIRSSLRGILSDEGFRVVDTGDAPGVMDLIARENPAIVLLDVWMPELDGIELLRRIKAEQPRVPRDHDLGPRQYPERGSGDQARRRGLYPEAIFGSGLLASIARALEGDSAGPDPIGARGMSAEVRAARAQGNSRRRVPQRTVAQSIVMGGQGLHSGLKTGVILASGAGQDSESYSPRSPTRPRFRSGSRTSPRLATTPRLPAAAIRSARSNI